jgi:hypothetical protein
MGWRGRVDHTSITLDRPGQSLRRWLPLQSLQGYLGLRGVWVILTSSTLLARLTVTGCFPTCLTVVGGFDPCLFFFFLFFLFFFFLFTELLVQNFHSTKKMKRKTTLQVKKAKKTLLVKMVKDQHEVDALGGKCLRSKHLLHLGLPKGKTTTPSIQL